MYSFYMKLIRVDSRVASSHAMRDSSPLMQDTRLRLVGHFSFAVLSKTFDLTAPNVITLFHCCTNFIHVIIGQNITPTDLS